jgi:hypothetical protein
MSVARLCALSDVTRAGYYALRYQSPVTMSKEQRKEMHEVHCLLNRGKIPVRPVTRLAWLDFLLV